MVSGNHECSFMYSAFDQAAMVSFFSIISPLRTKTHLLALILRVYAAILVIMMQFYAGSIVV
jgi:hypothetical protein